MRREVALGNGVVRAYWDRQDLDALRLRLRFSWFTLTRHLGYNGCNHARWRRGAKLGNGKRAHGVPERAFLAARAMVHAGLGYTGKSVLRKGTLTLYHFERLRVGQSRWYSTGEVKKPRSIMQAAKNWGDRHHARFTSRRTPHGIWITRIR